MSNLIHREAIAKVLTYIDSHRDDNLDLEKLSQIAGISKFHFHRIFKEHMDISLGQYIKLKRLENAMWKLVYNEGSTLEIAIDSGYENHAAFTRAFTKEMGCSPKEFREHFYREKKISLLRSHKKAPLFLGFQIREKVDIFYVRKTGSYFSAARAAWNELLGDLRTNGVPIEDQTYYGISQDDPNAPSMEIEKLRFDVCVEASIEIQQKKNELKARSGEIAGGKFAVFLHKGPIERLGDSYHFIYGKWIHDHKISLRDMRIFIKYKNPLNIEIPARERETEIYLPVVELPLQ